MGPITLYHNDMSVCSAKARMALAEKDAAWSGVHLDLRAGDTQTPEYTALNPNQLVPTLVTDGRALIESNVICEFVDDAWPTPPLRPADAFERARMRLWMKRLDDWIHAATGTVSLCIAFRHQFLARGEAAVAAYRSRLVDPARRERLDLALKHGMDAPAFAPAVRRLVRLLIELAAALGEHPYLAGESFSLADLAYAPYMVRFQALGLAEAIAARPRLAEWAERVIARPSCQSAVIEWLNPGAVAIMREQHDAARARIRAILAG
jgi:glutathione S-transferase